MLKTLTSEQLELKSRLDIISVAIADLLKERRSLVNSCKHVVTGIPTESYQSVKCGICNEAFGWGCSDSPDLTCHYYSIGNAGKEVKLIDGTIVPLELDEDFEEGDQWETYDHCLYCGQPNDR